MPTFTATAPIRPRSDERSQLAGVSVTTMFRRRRKSWIPIVWVVLGVIVAATHGFFAAVTTPAGLASAILAVIVWPLVLLNVHIAV